MIHEGTYTVSLKKQWSYNENPKMLKKLLQVQDKVVEKEMSKHITAYQEGNYLCSSNNFVSCAELNCRGCSVSAKRGRSLCAHLEFEF